MTWTNDAMGRWVLSVEGVARAEVLQIAGGEWVVDYLDDADPHASEGHATAEEARAVAERWCGPIDQTVSDR